MGRFLGRRHLPRPARPAGFGARQPRIRVARRWRRPEGRLHRPLHARGRRPRLRQARPDQAAHRRLVDRRRAAGADALRRRGQLHLGLERPHHAAEEGRRSRRGRVERRRPEALLCRHPQGHEAQGRGPAVRLLHDHRSGAQRRVRQDGRLSGHGEGPLRPHGRRGRTRAADLSGKPRRPVRHRRRVLGEEHGCAPGALAGVAARLSPSIDRRRVPRRAAALFLVP